VSSLARGEVERYAVEHISEDDTHFLSRMLFSRKLLLPASISLVRYAFSPHLAVSDVMDIVEANITASIVAMTRAEKTKRERKAAAIIAQRVAEAEAKVWREKRKQIDADRIVARYQKHYELPPAQARKDLCRALRGRVHYQCPDKPLTKKHRFCAACQLISDDYEERLEEIRTNTKGRRVSHAERAEAAKRAGFHGTVTCKGWDCAKEPETQSRIEHMERRFKCIAGCEHKVCAHVKRTHIRKYPTYEHTRRISCFVLTCEKRTLT
jgi:hypothetical protein